MNVEQNRRQCSVCGESEPSFIHTVRKINSFRRFCTDCLLKEHRDLFCSVCLTVFTAISSPNDRINCTNCSSIAHLSCSHPPSSSAAFSSASCFTCRPCFDPNFSFFPKLRVPSSDQSGDNDDDGDSGTPMDMESVKALVAAAKIAVACMGETSNHLKNEATKRIIEARVAKMRAKEALWNLQDIVLRQNASEDINR